MLVERTDGKVSKRAHHLNVGDPCANLLHCCSYLVVWSVVFAVGVAVEAVPEFVVGDDSSLYIKEVRLALACALSKQRHCKTIRLFFNSKVGA